MRRWITVFVSACFILSACGSPGGSGSGSRPASPESGVDSTVGMVDEAGGADESGVDISFLMSAPVFVEPTIDPARSVSVDVVALEGGSVSLALTGEVSVRLEIPPAALPFDSEVTLSPVTSLGDGTTEILGVDIQPSGLRFSTSALPMLHFEGVPADSAVTGWDDDGVVEIMNSWLTSDTSLVVAMRHFSGAAIGGVRDLPRTPFDDLQNEIRRDLTTEQTRQLLGEDCSECEAELNDRWRRQFMEMEESFVLPLLDEVAKGPCGFEAYDAMRIALRLEIGANVLSITKVEDPSGLRGYEVDRSHYERVINHEIDCAEKACESGDRSAIGKFMRAKSDGFLLGLNDGTLDMEVFERFALCGLYRVTVMGRANLVLPTSSVVEGFVAKGVVASEMSQNPIGPPTNLVPMNVTTSGYEEYASWATSAAVSGIAAGFLGVGPVNVPCTFSSIGPSVARVSVAYSDGDPASPRPEPLVRFKPFVSAGKTVCGTLEVPFSTWMLFLSHIAFGTLFFDGDDVRHAFTEAEGDRFGVFRFTDRIELGAIVPGLDGTSSILMNVQPVAEYEPPRTDLTTEGLVDKYAEAMSS